MSSGGLWASWVCGVFHVVYGSILCRLNDELGMHMQCSSNACVSGVIDANSGCHCVVRRFISYHTNSMIDFTSMRPINLQDHIKDQSTMNNEKPCLQN